jgi:stage IV sporulation protein A
VNGEVAGGEIVEKFDVYKDIAERTGGDIYIGVVGPVRTGKSTLVRKFMELMVLPNIDDPNERERAHDALPQSGTGRTIMTTEPKFIPDDGVEIRLHDQITFRVRLVDCVGYAVEGALGYADDDGPRLVDSPWFEEKVPFEEAAEVGTRKVIADHSTLGLVVTTDGSIGDLPRSAYLPAEERTVAELKELGKPFIVVLNTTHPYAQETADLARELEGTYDVPVVAVNAAYLTLPDIQLMLEQLLYEFPVKEVDILLPDWVAELPETHWLKAEFRAQVEEARARITRVREIDAAMAALAAYPHCAGVHLDNVDLGSGIATISTMAKTDLLYQVLGEIAGEPVDGHPALVRLWRIMSEARREYEKVAEALQEVRSTGYGVVPPSMDEMVFEEPELIRQGSRFSVRLRAGAPSIHMIRADVETEVTPIMGTERQCEELIQYLLDRFEDDPAKLWQSDIFGKSLSELVRDGIQNKLVRMPENAQEKLQETLQRIVNEGSSGLICIII